MAEPISRGKNFTEREKNTLAALIDKYKSIITNKCTNTVYTLEKNKTWEKITMEFNSSAQEKRTTKQLQGAYNNFKRLSRQSVVNENTGIKATGEGICTPVLSEAGTQMLDIIVKPLCNPYDSATEFYIAENLACNKVEPDSEPVSRGPSPLPPTKGVIESKRKTPKRKGNTTKDTIKMQYYRTKLECAMLEKKTRIVEYNSALKKQKLLDLEIKMKTAEYENIQNSSNGSI